MWPELWPAWELFVRVSTQWRIGGAGAVGLDYGAVYPLIDRHHARSSDEWLDMLDDIRCIEGAALDAIHEAG